MSLRKTNPKLYDFLMLLIAAVVLGVIFVPLSMYADNQDGLGSNIHSYKQLETFNQLEDIKSKSPIIHKSLIKAFRVNTEYCKEKLKGLDLHDSEYYRCKKIANSIQKELDAID